MIRLVLSAALALAAIAAAADDYYLDGYRENCPVGIGGEGIVSVGAGWFNSFDTRYERLGERQALGDGWSRATWACSAEGEDCGRERIDLRITEERLDLRFDDGRVITGLNCPG